MATSAHPLPSELSRYHILVDYEPHCIRVYSSLVHLKVLCPEDTHPSSGTVRVSQVIRGTPTGVVTPLKLSAGEGLPNVLNHK